MSQEKNSLKNLSKDIPSKEYRLMISPIARKMIFELVDYIAFELCDMDSAIRIRNGLIAFMQGMVVFPHRYLYDSHKFLKKLGIRKAVYKNYIVYLWIDELYKTVNILGVFHILTNSEQHFKEMFTIRNISHYPSQGDLITEF